MSELGTRSLTLSIATTDYTAQISKGRITSNPLANGGFISFFSAANGGGRQYRLEIEFVQDLAAGTLWDKVWTSPGQTFPYVMKPYGNATPSVSQPHFTGNVTIVEPDGDLIGGDADTDESARMLTECAWVCTARPTKVTA